eukprot:7497201-Pyramimonas_sp.AAC.1
MRRWGTPLGPSRGRAAARRRGGLGHEVANDRTAGSDLAAAHQEGKRSLVWPMIVPIWRTFVFQHLVP